MVYKFKHGIVYSCIQAQAARDLIFIGLPPSSSSFLSSIDTFSQWYSHNTMFFLGAENLEDKSNCKCWLIVIILNLQTSFSPYLSYGSNIPTFPICISCLTKKIADSVNKLNLFIIAESGQDMSDQDWSDAVENWDFQEIKEEFHKVRNSWYWAIRCTSPGIYSSW